MRDVENLFDVPKQDVAHIAMTGNCKPRPDVLPLGVAPAEGGSVIGINPFDQLDAPVSKIEIRDPCPTGDLCPSI